MIIIFFYICQIHIIICFSGIFDQLYTLAHEEISDISAILKDFRKTDYDVDLSEIEKSDTQYKLVQKDLRSQKKTLTTRKRELTDQTLNLTKKLRPVDESIIDIEKLSSNKIDYESQLESMDIRLGSVGATKEENKSKIIELKHRIKDYVNKDTNKKYLDLIKLENDKKELRIEIDKLKIEVRNKLDKIEKLGILEWDEDCEYCMSNPFTLDAIATNEKLDEDKKISGEIISDLDYLDLQIEDMSDIHDNKVDFDRSMEALKTIDINQNKLESEEILLKERKKNTLHQITLTEERIEKYHESKNDIVYNKQVEEEIDNLKNSIDDLDYQVETIDNKIQIVPYHCLIQVARHYLHHMQDKY